MIEWMTSSSPIIVVNSKTPSNTDLLVTGLAEFRREVDQCQCKHFSCKEGVLVFGVSPKVLSLCLGCFVSFGVHGVCSTPRWFEILAHGR